MDEEYDVIVLGTGLKVRSERMSSAMRWELVLCLVGMSFARTIVLCLDADGQVSVGYLHSNIHIYSGVHPFWPAVSARQEGPAYGSQRLLWRRERIHHPADQAF